MKSSEIEKISQNSLSSSPTPSPVKFKKSATPSKLYGGLVMTNFVRLPTVKARTGLSRSTIYAKIKDEAFPAPILLGERAVGWIEEEVSQWIDARIAHARGGGEANE